MDLPVIYTDKRSGGDLYRYLRCQKVRFKRYGTDGPARCHSQPVIDDKRPAIVDTPRRFGDWESGLNENTNGLIRQYFPKHRDLTTVSKTEIGQAMDRLHNRPRKSLGFRAPYEVFFKTKTSLTVALQS